jgi:uncharacterized membrane protein
MTLDKHRDVFSKPLGRLFYIIAMTFFTLMKTKKNIIVSLEEHYSVFLKTLECFFSILDVQAETRLKAERRGKKILVWVDNPSLILLSAYPERNRIGERKIS